MSPVPFRCNRAGSATERVIVDVRRQDERMDGDIFPSRVGSYCLQNLEPSLLGLVFISSDGCDGASISILPALI